MFNNNGVIQGAYLNNLNMVDDINDRISIRNKPSQPIKPNLSFRTVSMKYNSMSIGDNKNTNYNVGINSYPSYKTTDIFNPGNSVISGPPEGYQLNVDNESDLRNQVLPLNLRNNSGITCSLPISGPYTLCGLKIINFLKYFFPKLAPYNSVNILPPP